MSASSELVIDFLNLLEGNPSADWEVLVPTERDTWSGLYATAYFNTITGQIVTAFEGESTPGGNLGADVPMRSCSAERGPRHSTLPS
jgi:hypothetical protein